MFHFPSLLGFIFSVFVCIERNQKQWGKKWHFKPFVLKHFLVILGLPFELRKMDLFARAYFFSCLLHWLSILIVWGNTCGSL